MYNCFFTLDIVFLLVIPIWLYISLKKGFRSLESDMFWYKNDLIIRDLGILCIYIVIALVSLSAIFLPSSNLLGTVTLICICGFSIGGLALLLYATFLSWQKQRKRSL
jgi:hypothetical protein